MMSVEQIQNMNFSEYKTYHESFMKNNLGSSALHTLTCVLFTVQCTIVCSIVVDVKQKFIRYLYEYIVIVLPLILSHTILSEHIYFLNCVVFLIVIYFLYNRDKSHLDKTLKQPNQFHDDKILSISYLRGLTYLITAFCILAVDFNCFPRYLAKTEMYGYSLMDTGVGSFVLMSGLVHKDLRNNSIQTLVKDNIKFVIVLFSLGTIRFFSVKQLEYQEHVTEYGVHWNFFFTLAICKFISTILIYYCNRAILLSVLILVFHETMLYWVLEYWVLSHSPRVSLIEANREGISSCLGYISLYLFGVYIRKVLNKNVQKYVVIFELTFTATILFSISYSVNQYRYTSRTLANAGYCLYVESLLVTILSIIYTIEVLYTNKRSKCNHFNIPLILCAINYNGLIYFLSANLITGMINMCIKTFAVSVAVSILILNIYMALIITLAVFLLQKKIKIG